MLQKYLAIVAVSQQIKLITEKKLSTIYVKHKLNFRYIFCAMSSSRALLKICFSLSFANKVKRPRVCSGDKQSDMYYVIALEK